MIKGVGDLEGYGSHPGTPIYIYILLIIVFFFIGYRDSLVDGIYGAIVAAIVVGIPFFYGALDRYNSYEEDQVRKLETFSKM